MRTFLARLLPWLSLAAALTAAGPAHAETEAERLFQEGKELAAKGDLAGAADAYGRSFALQPAVDTACNLGSAEVELARWAEAATHLAYCARVLPNTAEADKKQRVAERLAKAREHVAAVTVTTVDGAKVVVDGVARGQAPLADPLFLAPGSHALEAQLPEHAPAKATVEAKEGTNDTVSLQPAPLARGAGFPRVPIAVAGGVLAGGTLAAGLGLFFAAQGKLDEAASLRATIAPGACANGGGGAPCVSLRGLASDADSLSNASTALFVASGLLAAATVVTLVLPSPAPAPTAARWRRAPPRVSLVPALGGAWLVGSY
jgi:hypothetical protein